MKLGIISDALHYWDAQGRLSVLSAVARQFEQWAELFDEVTVCAPLVAGLPPLTTSPYRARNIGLLPIREAGGNTIRAKLELFVKLPSWWAAVAELLTRVDAVHIRCPNNISIPALLAVQRSSVLRHAVYTGTWLGYPSEPRSYRWQREFLRDRFRGPVAVYGEWPGQPSHVVPSFSPSYREQDWLNETATVAAKLHRLHADETRRPLRILSIGRLDQNKNQRVAIRAIQSLVSMNVDARLDIIGEGPERNSLNDLICSLQLEERVTLQGAKPHLSVRQLYRDSDFVLQPTRLEGFGKVPLEAMFHGAIPILSHVTVHPQFAGTAGPDSRGRCFPTEDHAAAAAHIADLASRPDEMMRLVENGRRFARRYTLEAWKAHLQDVLQTHWGTQLT